METFIVFGSGYNGEVLSGELNGDKVFILPKDGISDRDASLVRVATRIIYPQFKVERYLSENGKTYLVATLDDGLDLATAERIESVIFSANPDPIN